MGYQWDRFDVKSYNNKVGKYKFSRIWEFINQYPISEKDNVLDIAGGSGRFAIPLFEKTGNITVLDVNREAIDILKKYNENIRTINADFNKINIEEKFSIVLCIEALNVFPDTSAFFDKVNDLLSVNGRFIFTYSNPQSWRFYMRKVMRHWKGYTSYYETNYKTLFNLLENKGWVVEKVDGMNWIPLKLSSNSIWVDFFIKIERIFRLNRWLSQSPWLLISVRKA
jgi:2-polyprenyl-3-methyl-5-hydroxy-6-metoxy-1,4-benzoquinol methylase